MYRSDNISMLFVIYEVLNIYIFFCLFISPCTGLNCIFYRATLEVRYSVGELRSEWCRGAMDAPSKDSLACIRSSRITLAGSMKLRPMRANKKTLYAVMDLNLLKNCITKCAFVGLRLFLTCGIYTEKIYNK